METNMLGQNVRVVEWLGDVEMTLVGTVRAVDYDSDEGSFMLLVELKYDGKYVTRAASDVVKAENS